MITHPLVAALVKGYHRLILAIVMGFVTVLVTANSFFRRVRMSHENGIACRGRLRIVDDPDIPPHDLFRPGAVYGCRIRHAAASFKDDAKLVVRSASLKFADDHFDSPLDLMMNSGKGPLFWNARTFVGFMAVTLAGRGKAFVPFLKRYPQAELGGGGAVRRNPESFGAMTYHTKCTTGFVDMEGNFWFCRYQLKPVVPPVPGADGFPDAFDVAHPWLQNPYRDETRTRNYLKDATIQWLNHDGKTLNYHLGIQLRPGIRGECPQWLSCAVAWDEERFPYKTIAEIELTEAMGYAESMHTWFDLNNHPESLPILPAVSVDDPNSLNQLRLASIWARRARLLSYRIWGMPKKFGNSRNDPDWEGIPPLLDPPPPPSGIPR